jgi:RHS repeat-associated protein
MSPKLPPKTRRVLGGKSHLRAEMRVHGKPQYPGADKVVSGLRYYMPSTGRWVNRDPIGERGGVNRYAMLSNDCLNAIDAIGLEKQQICNLRKKWGSGVFTGDSKGNCWRYAADDPKGPDEDHYVDPIPDRGQAFTCSEIRNAIIAKGGVEPTGTGECSCPKGNRRIKLVITEKWYAKYTDYFFGNDYHFYRQESDGSWTHKPGAGQVEETSSPNEDAKKRGYEQNCGDLCIPTHLDVDS